MSSVAVLQARTSSSRLPGKVLLPMAGLPLAILAARRAGNTGREVVVATSDELADDILVKLAIKHQLKVYRGSLNNTLQRVTDALADYPGSTLVFRLTADNIFPDGKLLDEMESCFVSKGFRYLVCGGIESGLPYGVSAELMYLSDLREANGLTDDPYDQEHVTPAIIRKYGKNFFEWYQALKKSHFRATVDCFDDYVAVQRVFEGVEDPVAEPLKALISRLEQVQFQPQGEYAASKLVLGTAQFGLNYGIANATGKPTPSSVSALIKQAISNGVNYLDTARAYGDSEYLIGSTLAQGWQGRAQVVTKLAPLEDCLPTASSRAVSAAVEASVYHSCSALRVRKLDVLLLHRAQYRKAWGGAAWAHLRHLKKHNVIGALGVSVQSPEELAACLDDPSVSHIQMPFNLLDWRWESTISDLRRARKSRGLVVHVRSALLQGLLTTQDSSLWWRAGIAEPSPIISWLERAKKSTGARTIAGLCISYCMAQDWIDGVVVGVDNEEQLMENLRAVEFSHMNHELLVGLAHDRPWVETEVLDPARWKSIDALT